MKMNKIFSFIFQVHIPVLLLFIALGTALAEDAPINIEANHMTSTEKSNSVVFTGDVDAKQGDVRIRSDEMTVYYTPKQTGTKKNSKGKQGASQQVEKMICIGNVEITRAEWLGTSKKMVYLSKERQVILTGNAKAWQGQNMVSGEKIIYYLDEGRSEVIGERTSATVSENDSGKKKKPSRVNMTILQN
ncbi:lipopolysaccharide transport periplasmic protein LptA [Desulforhopalus sp. IMCC35007]|uniref:lipopolysaccharide transport periplasmic protein LptA n=1 Tax=Desulforhopalus sp. IMCC35007 TaxID=2569543 RepID=UPI0010ADE097|nr:lipopolysaccharide transport periplasmic protein LptA [Desulforhopalus sp. IMCC35007]TKB11784.1 lipopolysaccharide transport periplasmic protein LptA [Desulforhopalus sp. IMCC35007]